MASASDRHVGDGWAAGSHYEGFSRALADALASVVLGRLRGSWAPIWGSCPGMWVGVHLMHRSRCLPHGSLRPYQALDSSWFFESLQDQGALLGAHHSSVTRPLFPRNLYRQNLPTSSCQVDCHLIVVVQAQEARRVLAGHVPYFVYCEGQILDCPVDTVEECGSGTGQENRVLNRPGAGGGSQRSEG